MFAQERQERIVELVNQYGTVKVKELAKKFEVTEDSIRKDLTLLENQGLLQKTYGGAMKKNRVNSHDLTISQRRDKNIESKQKIAMKALNLIKEGDMLFLDISTANVELARLLREQNKNITIVTNMVEIMLELRNAWQVDVIFIGGTFNRRNDGFIGSMAIEQIKKFRFDLAFLGVVGIDVYNNSVTTYMVEDGLTKQTIVEHARKSYLMLETRKFEMDGTYQYSNVESFSGAILDKKPSANLIQKMKEYPLDWIM